MISHVNRFLVNPFDTKDRNYHFAKFQVIKIIKNI